MGCHKDIAIAVLFIYAAIITVQQHQYKLKIALLYQKLYTYLISNYK